MKSKSRKISAHVINACVAMLFCLAAVFAEAAATPAAEQPEIFVQMGHSDSVHAAAFSSDGKLALSGGADNTVKLWDVSSGREIRTFSGHKGLIYSVAFSPDNRFALSGGTDTTVKLWDIHTGALVRTFQGHTSQIKVVTFSPDGRFVLSGGGVYSFEPPGDNSVRLWDASNGKELKVFRGHTARINCIAFTNDGRYVVSGSEDHSIKTWDIESGKEIKTQQASPQHATPTSLSADGRYTVLTTLSTIALWDLALDKIVKNITIPIDHRDTKGGVSSAYLSPDAATILSTSIDKDLMHEKDIHLWNVSAGKEIATLRGHEKSVDTVVFSPDGKSALSGGADHKLKFWDLATGKEVKSLQGNTSAVLSMAISQDDRKVFTGKLGSRTISQWDIATGKITQVFQVESDRVGSVSLSPDGKKLLSGSGRFQGTLDNTARLWNIANGSLVKLLQGHAEGVTTVAFSPSGEYAATGSYDNTIKLWDLSDGSILWSRKQPGQVISLAFSPNGRSIVSGNSGADIHLLNAMTGELIMTFDGHTEKIVFAAAFSPNGDYLLSGGRDSTVRYWNARTGSLIRTFKGHISDVRSVAFSADGRYGLSGGGDNVRMWDLEKGTEVKVFQRTGMGDTFSVAFSHDGRQVLSGTRSGALIIWDRDSGKEIAQYIGFNDGEWLNITPEGYYNASPNGEKNLNIRIGNNVYGIENYRETFFRPDLVKLALTGGSLKDLRSIADIRQPPKVSIVQTPVTSGSEETRVTIRIEEQGGGIGDVRLFLNGSAIVLDNGRSLKVVVKSGQGTVYRSYTVRLSNGHNTLKAIAFNADNSMQSNPAEHNIAATFQAMRKPVMHALVIGIQEFKNPKLQLKYSIADAELFAGTLQKGTAGLFENARITRLTTRETTSRDSIIAALKSYQSLNPDDLFILYVASHGTVDDGEYFLVTSNVGATSSHRLKSDAISQTDLKELVANIPATKKMILIDTCNAGKLGESLQMAMLTRGMSEDTAMKVLSRAVGSTILSASTSVQEALEGYSGHGLFTWTLVEGWLGKADKGNSGYIKSTDLATYVEDEVPTLAEKVFKRAQYPTVSISGQGFPVGKVR